MSEGNKLIFSRILLKLSGQSLGSEYGAGFSRLNIIDIVKKIKDIHALGVEIAIVVGGGNFLRGKSIVELGTDRAGADKIGMMATIMNAISLQDALEEVGVETRTLSAITVSKIAEPYIRRRALRHFEKGRVVIFGAGTGNPYFTTDTAAALRAVEIGADILLKATKVNGVYNKDPEKFSNAIKYTTLSYSEAMLKNLKIMDMTAFSLCKENNLPVIVFNMLGENNILKAVLGESVGTIIKEDNK
jgi:uridylate kinase